MAEPRTHPRTGYRRARSGLVEAGAWAAVVTSLVAGVACLGLIVASAAAGDYSDTAVHASFGLFLASAAGAVAAQSLQLLRSRARGAA